MSRLYTKLEGFTDFIEDIMPIIFFFALIVVNYFLWSRL